MRKDRNALPVKLLKPHSPTVEYLLSASNEILQEFFLARLSQSANLRKQLTFLIDEMVSASAEALLASVIMERRKKLGSIPTPHDEVARYIAEVLLPASRERKTKHAKQLEQKSIPEKSEP